MLRYLVLWLFLLIFPFLASANDSPNYAYFADHEIQLGIYDNDFMPINTWHPPHPFFWTSRVKANGGATLIYQWQKYHTKKYFSVNLATSLSDWVIHSQNEVAASFFFVVHVWFCHTKYFSPYFDWSMAGPTLLSLRNFHGANLGERFIFQDFFGLGMVLGSSHHFDLNANIYHYSNGDLFVHNDGFDVPIVFSIGYQF